MQHETREVLVIDDDQDLNARLCQVLTQAGYRTASARSAEAGIVRVRTSPPALILLDINMPGMGGLGFLRQVQSPPHAPPIPILVLTARSAMERFFDGMPVGGFLAKPCDTHDLLEHVMRLLPGKPASPPQQDRSTPCATGSILLGEDDPRIVTELRRQFMRAGYRTLPAVSLTEMYDAATREPPDAIIMRRHLHTLSDAEVVPMLRSLPCAPHKPVLTYQAVRHNTREASCGLVFTPGIEAFMEIPGALALLHAIGSVVPGREAA